MMMVSVILLTVYQQSEINHLRNILLNDLTRVLPRGEIFRAEFEKIATESFRDENRVGYFSSEMSIHVVVNNDGFISLRRASGLEMPYQQSNINRPFSLQELKDHAQSLGVKPIFLNNLVQADISKEDDRYRLSASFVGPEGIRCFARCFEFSLDLKDGFPMNGLVKFYNPVYPLVPERLTKEMPPLRLADFAEFDSREGEIFNKYYWFDSNREKFNSFDESRNTSIPQLLRQQITLISNKLTSKQALLRQVRKDVDGKIVDFGKVVNLDGATQNTEAIQQKMVAIDKVKSWQYVGTEDHRKGVLQSASEQTARSAELNRARSEAVLINDRGYFYKVQTSANRDVVKLSGQWFIFVEKKE